MRKLISGLMCLVPLVGFCMYSQTSNHQHQNFSHHSSQYSQTSDQINFNWVNKYQYNISEEIINSIKNNVKKDYDFIGTTVGSVKCYFHIFESMVYMVYASNNLPEFISLELKYVTTTEDYNNTLSGMNSHVQESKIIGEY